MFSDGLTCTVTCKIKRKFINGQNGREESTQNTTVIVPKVLRVQAIRSKQLRNIQYIIIEGPKTGTGIPAFALISRESPARLSRLTFDPAFDHCCLVESLWIGLLGGMHGNRLARTTVPRLFRICLILSSSFLLGRCDTSLRGCAFSCVPSHLARPSWFLDTVVAGAPSRNGWDLPVPWKSVGGFVKFVDSRRLLAVTMSTNQKGVGPGSYGKNRPQNRTAKFKNDSPAARRNVKLLSDIVAKKNLPGALREGWLSLEALKDIGKPLSGRTFTMLMTICAEQVTHRNLQIRRETFQICQYLDFLFT
jgi:hypothetical protein